MATAVSSSRGGVSPSSSPRLPSPPPMPELQFGPQSPLTGPAGEVEDEASERANESARRRVRPGTKATDMAKGPPLVPLTQVDSAFPLQEHLKAIYGHLTHGQDPDHFSPISKETAYQIARPPQLDDGESADRNLWLYELCRFLTMKAGFVSCALMDDKPACSAMTCPEMRASEWQYLCAVHEPPKSCCAIDYVNHTLDWAANVLTSTKHFPSRLQLGGETGSILQSMRQLTNIFRRVYRIFAHAWFQHREVFWHIEASHGIYMLFKTVCDEYRLIPEDNYTIPPEAEGPRNEAGDTPVNATSSNEQVMSMHILRKDAAEALSQNDGESSSSPPKETPAATARRHRHTPSTGSHVTTIAEGAEDEDDIPPVPKIPSPNATAVAPPTRTSPGKLDISPATLTQSSATTQPEDPTPTVAPVSDPLAAAGAATVNNTSSPDPSPAKPEPPKPTISVKPLNRRTSDFESEVHSPGGGSIRTAGPDLLGAILGHMDDREREEVAAAAAAAKGEETPEMDGDEETVVFVGAEDERIEHTGDGKATEIAAGVGDTATEDVAKDDAEDEDDAETMEEIMLPHRRKEGD